MADFMGGAFPIVRVGSNILANQLGNRAVNNVVNTGLGIALSPIAGANLSRALGLNTASGTNPLANLVTSDVAGLSQQTVNQLVNNAIVNSGIAGPFANLLSDVSRLGVQRLGQNFSNLLNSANNATADRAFPGAGGEPDAQYQGSAYSINSGPDVVFSIVPATTTAQFDGLGQIAGLNVPTSVNSFQLTGVNTGIDYKTSTFGSGLNPGDFISSQGAEFGTAKQFETYANISIPGLGAKDLTKQYLFQLPRQGGWTFICAPQDINWDLSAQVSRVEIFGTNTPPLISGTKGMRNLNLSNSIAEGFSRGKAVEDKIIQLERLINFTLSDKGFVNVPVYYVTANNKKYGDADGGYFILKDIKVKESMRDLSGKATRAVTDVSLVQVPSYQVDTGVDQASKAQTGSKSALAEVGQDFTTKANQVGTTAAARSGSGVPAAATPAGSSGGGGNNKNQPTADLIDPNRRTSF